MYITNHPFPELIQSLEPMYKEHCYCPCSLRSESEQATCHHSLRRRHRCHFSLSFTLSLPFSVLPPAFLLRFVSLFTRSIMRAGSDPMIIITERCSMLTRRLACGYLNDSQTELTGQDCSITRKGRILPQTRKIIYQSKVGPCSETSHPTTIACPYPEG